MIRTCRVKLGRAPKQEAKLLAVLELCRQLYNAALEQRIQAHRRGKNLSRYDQYNELTVLRADDERYRQLPVDMTRETSLARLDLAFRAFFRRLRTGGKPGFPRFKGRGRFDTLVCGRRAWSSSGRRLVIKTGSGPISFQMKNGLHRRGEVVGLRLIRTASRWWAHFAVEIGPAPAVQPSRHGVGIDVGLTTFATLSDGARVEHPRFLRKSLAQLRTAQQDLSRKKRGSRRRKKAKTVVVRIHEKIANRRRNFIHQTVAVLMRQYDGFAVEDLDVQELTSTAPGTRGLRRGIMDSAWAAFTRHLADKAEEAGRPVVRVNPRGTTQRCSGCGSLVHKGLGDRWHDCAACGLSLDRDHNAALNILALGANDLGCRSAPKGAESS